MKNMIFLLKVNFFLILDKMNLKNDNDLYSLIFCKYLNFYAIKRYFLFIRFFRYCQFVLLNDLNKFPDSPFKSWVKCPKNTAIFDFLIKLKKMSLFTIFMPFLWINLRLKKVQKSDFMIMERRTDSYKVEC